MLDRIDCMIEGDSVTELQHIPNESVHMILSDIPYGIGMEAWDVLHANTNTALLGQSPAQQRAGRVFHRRGKPVNGWAASDRTIGQQYADWCAMWASQWLRVLKPGGSAMVFAGRRLAHRCGTTLEAAGFTVKDTLAWIRPTAPHRAQRMSQVYLRRQQPDAAARWEGWRIGNLAPVYEPILWFVKPYPIGTTITDNAAQHGVGGYNEDAFLAYVERPVNLIHCGIAAGEPMLHPTQKPLRLMQALIALCTQAGQVVLDPFAGSGTTLVAAALLRRHYLGIERDPAYVAMAMRRLAPFAGGNEG